MTTTEQLLALAATFLPMLCVLLLVRERTLGVGAAFVALVAFAFTAVWAYHKAPYEGPAIITLTSTHGLNVVDLVVPPSLAAEAGVLWRARGAVRRLLAG
jgi:hypothetical protein